MELTFTLNSTDPGGGRPRSYERGDTQIALRFGARLDGPASNNSIIDDVWCWRVIAYGLAVEHYQKDETEWNGQGGTVIFFQNENPYQVPHQAAWMASSSQDGYPAFYIPSGVTSLGMAGSPT